MSFALKYFASFIQGRIILYSAVKKTKKKKERKKN